MKIFGREPALCIAAVYAALIMLSTFSLPGVDGGLAAGVQLFLTAGATAATAFTVKPIAPAVFSGVITTGAALVSRFGLDLSDAQVGSITALAAVLVILVARSQITPVNDPRRLDQPLG